MRTITIDYDATDALPLDLETVKTDLRISGSELDSVLQSQYMPAALEWAEGYTKRSLLTRTHRWLLTDFPRTIDQTLFLPRGLVSSIASIIYSSGGSLTTLTGPSAGSPGGTDYAEDLTGHVARIMPNRGNTWPTVDADVLQPIKVTYAAGWLSDKLIPGDIKRALTAYVFQALELDGLLTVKVGDRASADMEFPEKLLSAYRTVSA